MILNSGAARIWLLSIFSLTIAVAGPTDFSRPALAQENSETVPDWRIKNICRNDSAVGQCRLYEEVARQRLIASWTLIPPKWRETCLLRFRPPLEPSWRILGQCIDDEARREEVLRAQQADKLSIAEAAKLRETQLAARKAAEEARLQAEAEEAARKAAEEARLQAEAEEATRKAAEEARLQAEAEEAARKAAEEARLQAEAEEAARKAAEEARLQAEAEEDARRAAEEARLQAEADEAARKAEEKARLQAEAEEAARKAAENARLLAEAEEAARKAAEEERLKAEAEEARRKAAAEEAARIAEEKARIAAEEARLTRIERACRDKIRAVIDPDPIKFETARYRVRKVAREQLDQVITIAATCPTVRFRIEGHTDSLGDEGTNLWLSKKRAQAVVDHLVRGGLSPDRVRAVGYGETRPIAENDSRAGRGLNRRIDFNVELSNQ